MTDPVVPIVLNVLGKGCTFNPTSPPSCPVPGTTVFFAIRFVRAVLFMGFFLALNFNRVVFWWYIGGGLSTGFGVLTGVDDNERLSSSNTGDLPRGVELRRPLKVHRLTSNN